MYDDRERSKASVSDTFRKKPRWMFHLINSGGFQICGPWTIFNERDPACEYQGNVATGKKSWGVVEFGGGVVVKVQGPFCAWVAWAQGHTPLVPALKRAL